MPFACICDLEQFLNSHIPAGKPPIAMVAEICPPDMTGDITVNCFRAASQWKTNPQEMAERVLAFLAAHPDVEHAACVKAFVNVALRPVPLYRDTVANADELFVDVSLPAEQRETILVEYSAPNTNKPQHLGHVRNNCLGSALVAILSRVGHQVHAVNLVNDRGIHICKSMIAYQRFGNHVSPAGAGKKGDHFVGDMYVAFEREFQRQVAELKATHSEYADQPAEELFLNTEIGQATQTMLRQWEQGNPRVRSLWQTLNGWVLDGFAATYETFEVPFDHTYYESETYNFGRQLVLRELDNGVFYKRPDGAVEIDLSPEKLDKKVVLRADGTSVYVTQDIGTTVLKENEFHPQRMIWIVGNEQIHHFKVLFAILARMGMQSAANFIHIPYGMVNLPSGKMKSREGTVVDADEIMEEMMGLARQATLERSEGQTPNDLEKRAHTIALGAIKLMLLKVNPKTTMTFDPNASIKFEGDTGPYIQYAYARIASILRRYTAAGGVPDAPPDWGLLVESEEKALAVRSAMYGAIVRRAAEAYDTSVVANYLLDITREFNRFYKNHSVLSAASPALCHARVALCRRIQAIIKDGLNTLAIGTLEAM